MCASTMFDKKLPPSRPDGIKRVQVGCKRNAIANWWNVDIRWFPGVDQVMDATQRWPWSDLTHVYGEHFLEHLDLDGSVAFLSHSGNALRRGGRLRLSTPSLEWVLATNSPSSGTDEERAIADTIRINRAFHGWGHRFLYSKPFLSLLLREFGFEGVTFHDYGESNDPSLRKLEQHADHGSAGGYPHVWIVEASRGTMPIDVPSALSARLTNEFTRYIRSGNVNCASLLFRRLTRRLSAVRLYPSMLCMYFPAIVA